MVKKFIFCPVVNNFHLLEKAIKSVPPNLYDEYLIFNNSNAPLPIDTLHWKVINETRKTFLETQNIMRQYAIDHNYDWYSFMHNDAEVIEGVERLVHSADTLTTTGKKWSVIYTTYDVLCAFSTEAVKEIGEWGDEGWPKDQLNGYFLDLDYYNRMRLSNFSLYQLRRSNVLHHERSNTIKNPEEFKKWEPIRAKVALYYNEKWKDKTVIKNILTRIG
jgi:hypothetical protein